MSEHPHTYLIDLLAAQDSAAAFGCGLQPRLLKLLFDRHGTAAGTHPLPCPIRADGPAQHAPDAMPRIGSHPVRTESMTHARR